MRYTRYLLVAAAACAVLDLPATASAQEVMMATMTPRAAYSNDTSWMPAARKTPVQLKVTALNGETVDFAAWRGKIVAIELWSPFDCDACTESEDALKAVYAKYHAHGFEILRIVSGDSSVDKTMLVDEAKDNGVSWLITFTPNDDAEALLKQYHIDFLPAIILYDQQGRFVSNTLKGDDLDAFLNRAFKGSGSKLKSGTPAKERR